MKKGIILVAMLLSTLICRAQLEKPYIEVMGSAETEIAPNIIVLSILLKEYEENKTKVSLDKIEKEFIEATKRSKIAQDKIALSDFSLNGISQKRRERETYAQRTYQVTFSNTEDVIMFLENLKNVKVDYLNVVRLSHTEIEKYRLDVKVEALKQAQLKADALLNSVGAKRGKPIIVNENTSQDSWRSPQNNLTSNAVFDVIGDADTDGEAPLKKIKLRFEILARFEIQ